MAERNRYSDYSTEVSCVDWVCACVLELTGEGAVENTAALFLAQFSARLRFCMPSPG